MSKNWLAGSFELTEPATSENQNTASAVENPVEKNINQLPVEDENIQRKQEKKSWT